MSADWTSLDEIGGTPATLASAGYEDRAAALQELVRDAHVYLTQGLDTDFAPLIVVADHTDWARGGDETPPYGIPYASDDGPELVIPADPRTLGARSGFVPLHYQVSLSERWEPPDMLVMSVGGRVVSRWASTSPRQQ